MKRLARSHSLPRNTIGGTPCPGGPIVLPTDRVPYVVQSLTPRQIAAIPQYSFSVRVLGPERSLGVLRAVRLAKDYAPSHTLGVVVKGPTALTGAWANKDIILAQDVKLLSDFSLATPLQIKAVRGRAKSPYAPRIPPARTRNARLAYANHMKASDVIGTFDKDSVVVLIGKVNEFQTALIEAGNYFQGEDKNSDNTPSEKDIFCEPIDETKMAACIREVFDKCFKGEKTCVLDKMTCKIPDFFVLMHIAFDKMNLLKKKSLKPFCEFLQGKVLMSTKELTIRTFGYYGAKKSYKDLRDMLVNQKVYSFSLNSPPPKTSNVYVLSCHRIARICQRSAYFDELNRLMKNLQEMVI